MGLFSGIGNFFKGAVDIISTPFRAVMGGISGFMNNGLEGAFKGVVNAFLTPFMPAPNYTPVQRSITKEPEPEPKPEPICHNNHCHVGDKVVYHQSKNSETSYNTNNDHHHHYHHHADNDYNNDHDSHGWCPTKERFV